MYTVTIEAEDRMEKRRFRMDAADIDKLMNHMAIFYEEVHRCQPS